MSNPNRSNRPARSILLALACALFSFACSTVPAARELEPTPDAPACPDVVCAWTNEGQCPDGAAFSAANTREDAEGMTCFTYTAACVFSSEGASVPVPAGCIPTECKQNQFTTCTTL